MKQFMIQFLAFIAFATHLNADEVIAINIALEPDQIMIEHTLRANSRLKKVYPNGYEFGPTYIPHITLLQRFVLSKDLDKVLKVVHSVSENPSSWKLKAYKYYYIPLNGIGIAAIAIERTEEMMRLQQKLSDAVAPYTVKTGSPSAFFRTTGEREIVQSDIDYVTDFVPNQTGKNFVPHVSIGIAPVDYLKDMITEPFIPFAFSPTTISVFQLGNDGTVRKKL